VGEGGKKHGVDWCRIYVQIFSGKGVLRGEKVFKRPERGSLGTQEGGSSRGGAE